MNHLSKGYKRTSDENWGQMAIIGFLGQKPRFRAQKKPTSQLQQCFRHDQKKLLKEKRTLFQNRYKSLKKFRVFFLVKCFFGQKNTFWLNVKTAVSQQTQPGLGQLSFWVIFLMAGTVPQSFVENGPKLRLLITERWWEFPETAKNGGEPQKITDSSETDFWVV